MKNIKYIFIAILTSISLTSCYSDDPINEVMIEGGISNIVLAVTANNTIVAEGGDISFTATLPSAAVTDTTVEVVLLFTGGKVVSSVVVLAGATSAVGTITVPEDPNDENNFGGGSVKQLSLSGYLPADLKAGETSVFDVSSNVLDYRPFDQLQWPYGSAVVSGRMTALFDFALPTDGSERDLDMLMYNADTFAAVESAASGSRYETDIFNDTHPDGNYFVAIDFWRASGDIPWEIFFVHPDQTTVSYFNGVFEDTANGDFIFPVINFTKTTDAAGLVSYTFSQP